MFKRPSLKPYQDRWLEAERKLVVNGGQSNNEITRDDFMDALKRASRRIDRTKASPKSS